MITVSATSNGTVVGEDSTALSKLNKGIYDRYKKDIEEEESPPSAANRYKNIAFNTDLKTGLFSGSSSHFSSNYNPIGDVINLNLLDVYSNNNGFNPGFSNTTAPVSVYEFLLSLVPPNILTNTYEYWDKSYIETFLPRIKSMFRYYFASKNADSRFTSDENPTSGFIPFNLSLTMDGLSGMKIFQKFRINSDMLPSNYPETLEFIINSVDHEISEGKWTTSINSFCTSTHETAAAVANTATSNNLTSPASTGTNVDVVQDNVFYDPLGNYNIGNLTRSVGNTHPGIDIAANEGQGVYAMDDGMFTINTNDLCVAGNKDCKGGRGNYFTLKTKDLIITYMHFLKYSDEINNKGISKEVKKGDLIGYVGNTGQSDGNHLHLEIEANTNSPYAQYYWWHFKDISGKQRIPFHSRYPTTTDGSYKLNYINPLFLLPNRAKRNPSMFWLDRCTDNQSYFLTTTYT